MDSCINYYREESPSLRYSAGQLFLDNGAYSATRKGIKLDEETIMTVQETLDPTFTIPLDYPFNAREKSESAMSKLWEKTRQNILRWQTSSSLAGRLIPSLHAWGKHSLDQNVGWLTHHADSDYVALGSLVNSDRGQDPMQGYFGDRQPRRQIIDMVLSAIQAIRQSSDFKIHLMGFGSSPLMLHLGYYLGIDSTDSSGHRRKAAFGKIILMSTGERYLGLDSNVFGKGMSLTNRRVSDVAELEACSCEICLVNKDLLWTDWKARALHNEHTMKVERENAKVLRSYGEDAYESYLDLIFSGSSLRNLWNYAKLRKRESVA
jgi:queuine/archaeosine tRNA-ribosyltransferase